MAESDQPGQVAPNSAADEQIGRLLNDYLERRGRGERVSRDVLQSEHPELAEVLAEHLSLLQALAPSSDAIQELLANVQRSRREWPGIPKGRPSPEKPSTLAKRSSGLGTRLWRTV